MGFPHQWEASSWGSLLHVQKTVTTKSLIILISLIGKVKEASQSRDTVTVLE